MSQELPPIATANARHEEFVRLLGAYQGRIYGFVFTLLPHRTEAEELLQQVSVTLWRKFDTFDRSGDFVRWACGVAYNEIRHHRRARGREQRAMSEAVMQRAMSEAVMQRVRDARLECSQELDERREVLGSCLEQLSPKDRLLIECYYYRGKVTADEVSKAVGRSTQAVYKSLQRIRLALHQCIEQRLTGEDSQ